MKKVLNGTEELGVVFWVYFFMPAMLLGGMSIPLFLSSISFVGLDNLVALFLLVPMPWLAFVVIGICRCAKSSSSQAAALITVGIFAMLYLLIISGIHGGFMAIG